MSVPGISVWFSGELTCSGMCVVLTPTLWRYQSSSQTLPRMAGEMDPHLWAFLLRFWSEDSLWMTCSSLLRKEVENGNFKGSGFMQYEQSSLRGMFLMAFSAT